MALRPPRTGLCTISWTSGGERQNWKSKGACLGLKADLLPLSLNCLISVAIEEFVCYRLRMSLVTGRIGLQATGRSVALKRLAHRPLRSRGLKAAGGRAPSRRR